MRIERKLSSYFWFIIKVMPLLLYCVTFYKSGNFAEFDNLIQTFKFDYVYDLLVNVLGVADVVDVPNVLLIYCSYIFAVELAHLILDSILFIVRFSQKLLNRWLYE